MNYGNPNTYLEQFVQLETEYLSRVTKPLVGFLCLRVPVELIEACGAVPVRIVSTPDVLLEGYSSIRTDACSFCRSIPFMLNTKPYNRLKAIIAGTCCDQMRRLTETLNNILDLPVILFGAPRTWHSDKSYFIAEMRRAFDRLGEVTGTSFNKDELNHFIENRQRLRKQIMLMRDTETLPTDLLNRIAGSPLPAEQIIAFLEKIEPVPQSDNKIRLMLVGSIPSGKELYITQEIGGQIVADATCLGDRAFTIPNSTNSDPIEFLYQHYVEDNLCPHRRPYHPLIEYVRVLAERRKVDGIIYRSVKFCHPYGLAAFRFKTELNVPFLHLDDDLSLQAVSSFRTRIGAFIEMLEAKKNLKR